MKWLLTVLGFAALAAAPAKAERWVTYGDALDHMEPDTATLERMRGRCQWEQVDLDSVTRNGPIATFNDRTYLCENPNRSRVRIGVKVNCLTKQNYVNPQLSNRGESWSEPIPRWNDWLLRPRFLRRLELVCQ